MRILFLSNLYPPLSRGGYEQWCQEVAVELAGRKHQVAILTSHARQGVTIYNEQNVQVHRLLNLEVEGGLAQTVFRLLLTRRQLEDKNLVQTKKLISAYQPDIALIWGMWNVPRSVPALVEKLLPGRVAYFLCDYWLSLPNAYIQRWQASARQSLTQLPKQLLGNYFLPKLEQEKAVSLQLNHPVCVSYAVKELLIQADVPVSHAKVIYGGTQVDEFITASATRKKHQTKHPLKLLYAGRLDVEKGVHTIIKAFKLMAEQNNKNVTLDIFGKGTPDYEALLKTTVKENQLEHVISFQGNVPRVEIPEVLAQYDGLIFSSEWDEPFARTVLEAMAAGLVVIGTTTGGTGEILVDGKTGLTYTAKNPQTLADKIYRLSNNFTLQKKLAHAGQQCVVQNFTFSRMVDQIEAALQDITNSSIETKQKN